MPVTMRITKAGIVILLKRLPILTMSATSSSSDLVYDLRTGTRTIPMKIEPPTHIEEHMRCTHNTRPSTTAIIIFRYLPHILLMRQPKGFNHLLESANLNLIIGRRRIALIGAIAAVAL